jgi:hypothetical protein
MKKIPLNTSLLVISTILGLIAYQAYIYISSPQVPFMDTMRLLTQLEDIITGESSWFAIYGAGEHRGLIYPFITLIEWLFWRVDARVTTVVTGFIVVATFFIAAKAVLSSLEKSSSFKGGAVLTAVILLSSLIFVSPAGFELWTLDLGFAQLFKNFLIVMFLYWIAITRYWMASINHSIAVGFVGGFLIIFCTYGWSYPFYAAAVFSVFISSLQAKQQRSNGIVLILLLTLAQITYVVSGTGVFSNSGSVESNPFSLASTIKAICYGASTVFIGSELISKLSIPLSMAIFFGATLVCAGSVAVVTVLINRNPTKIFFASLFIFSLAVLVGVSLARGMINFQNAGAPRYYVDFIWLILAALGILFSSNGQNPAGAGDPPVIRILRSIFFFLFMVAVIGHSCTWIAEIRAAPYRAMAFKKMAEVYERGVATQDDAKLLQSPFPTAKEAVEIAQRYRLAVIRDENVGCALQTARYLEGLYMPEKNHARWMGKSGSIMVRGCPSSFVIKGYIPGSFTARKLSVQYNNTLQEIDVTPGQEFLVRVENANPDRGLILLSVDETTTPSLSLNSADVRELGVLITGLGKE